MSPTFTGGAVRRAAVAGRFYPGQADPLRQEVGGFFDRVAVDPGPGPKAVIAPHAGYIYSGPVAASAFAAWRSERATIRRVILLGPSHYLDFPGLALSPARAFATPLGEVSVEAEAKLQLDSLAQVRVAEEPHRPEHALEVELPFLQVLLESFTIVPLLTGEASGKEVAEVIDRLWGGPETRVVVSSDLSHYHDYAEARRMDRVTARAIEDLDGGQLESARACGWVAIRGLLEVARRRGLRVRTLELRNSGDTSGPRDRVVGYGAFHFVEGPNN